MNPVAREEAIKVAKYIKRDVAVIDANAVKEILNGIFLSNGANARTAWTNAQEIYAEVFA